MRPTAGPCLSWLCVEGVKGCFNSSLDDHERCVALLLQMGGSAIDEVVAAENEW